jgi:hypothetical protein
MIRRLLACVHDLFLPPRRPATFLSEAEAVAKARAVAAQCGITLHIGSFGVKQIDNRLCWIVGTMVKDMNWTIIVDDASGDVQEPELWNGWNGSVRTYTQVMEDARR